MGNIGESGESESCGSVWRSADVFEDGVMENNSVDRAHD